MVVRQDLVTDGKVGPWRGKFRLHFVKTWVWLDHKERRKSKRNPPSRTVRRIPRDEKERLKITEREKVKGKKGVWWLRLFTFLLRLTIGWGEVCKSYLWTGGTESLALTFTPPAANKIYTQMKARQFQEKKKRLKNQVSRLIDSSYNLI